MRIQNKNRKKRKKKGKNYYFTIDHENAIVQYSNTDCIKERTRLYVNFIQPEFSEMVDKIVFTYKFTNLPNCDYLRDECKIWLMTILDKFDPSKGSAAFSYFSVITKNWFIHKVKRQQKRNRREIDYENISKSYEEKYLSPSKSKSSLVTPMPALALPSSSRAQPRNGATSVKVQSPLFIHN